MKSVSDVHASLQKIHHASIFPVYNNREKAPDPVRKAGKKFMKKILSAILSVCLLAGTAAFAEEETAVPVVQVSDDMLAEEETGDDSILLKIWDQSGLGITYLRFDLYVGDEYRGLVASCPDEGEDFYRVPFEAAPEELKDLRVRCAYGVSELAPEDAILELMKGNPAEEYEIEAPELVPESGKIYHLILAANGEEPLLVLLDGTAEDTPAEEQDPAA